MENYPFIKQDIKNIIGKVFLIYEQFKTAIKMLKKKPVA